MSRPTVNWRPGSQQPERWPMTALIALRDPDDGVFFLAGGGIYEWRGDHWRHEASEERLDRAPDAFWWLPESELMQPEAFPC